MGGEFWAALFGAVAGGFASALGSMFVARRQLKKTMRLRIYDELLPPIRMERVYYALRRIPAGHDEMPVDPPNPTVEFMERMWGLSRAGAIIGGKTARLTKEIQHSVGRQVVYVSGESRLRPVWIPDAKIVEQLDDRITELLTELEQCLAKKLD